MFYAEIEARRVRALDAAIPGWRERAETGRANAVELHIREEGKVAVARVADLGERQALMEALRHEFPGIAIMFESPHDGARPG